MIPNRRSSPCHERSFSAENRTFR
ncbi:hypothetical protein RHECNPAF_280033 [Rhizobium etli CNPAF512]|nr:hypothetical protein RHECNPAF_280033 [Rhizobium etli CNPAF512]